MMNLNLVLCVQLVLVIVSLTSSFTSAHIYDVTDPKYGGKPGAELKEAVLKAFAEACACVEPSTILIPKGIFPLKEAEFKGPCKAPMVMKVEGTLQAPQDAKVLTKKDTWVSFMYLNDFTLTGGGVFDGQGQKGWKANSKPSAGICDGTINIRFHAMKNSCMREVTSLNSKNFHINIIESEGFTFDRVTIIAPDESPNTDGIHLGRSTNVNITNSSIKTGDDCISIGDGMKQLTIEGVTCGPGHGISLGSLGKYENEDNVCGIFVRNCTLTKTQTGVRIKTWPSGPIAITATNIHFEDIVMQDVEMPIVLDQVYCPHNQCDKKGSSKIKISNVSFKNIRGTSTFPLGLKIHCSPSNPCEGVVLENIDLKYVAGPITSQCTNVKPKIVNVGPGLCCATDKVLDLANMGVSVDTSKLGSKPKK